MQGVLQECDHRLVSKTDFRFASNFESQKKKKRAEEDVTRVADPNRATQLIQ